MGSNLRVIATLNCYGIKTSLSTIVDLFNESDIVFLQETLLFPHKLCILSNVHPEFEGMALVLLILRLVLLLGAHTEFSYIKVIEKCTNFYFGTEKLPPKF